MAHITPEETRRYYDRNAGVYDTKTGFGRPGGQEYNFDRYYEPFLEQELPRQGRVLELGCGTGFYTRWMATRGLEVCAVDISPQMIDLARAQEASGIRYFIGDCEDPASALGATVPDGFDAIVGINTFSYYQNKLPALRRYHELLRDCGRLVMLDMNGDSLTQRIAYLLNYRGARRFAGNIDQSTPATLTAMLTEAGFRVDRMERATFMPNEFDARGTALLAPLDRLLSCIPLADRIAFRIYWTATRI